MSTDLFTRPGLLVTSFYGGEDRGPCLQITTGRGYVQLDALDVRALAFVLDGWLGRDSVKETETT